jgi:hypothetical protein
MKFSFKKRCLFNANVCVINCFVAFGSLLSSRNVIYIQDVPGGKDLTSGECSLGQIIPI